MKSDSENVYPAKKRPGRPVLRSRKRPMTTATVGLSPSRKNVAPSVREGKRTRCSDGTKRRLTSNVTEANNSVVAAPSRSSAGDTSPLRSGSKLPTASEGCADSKLISQEHNLNIFDKLEVKPTPIKSGHPECSSASAGVANGRTYSPPPSVSENEIWFKKAFLMARLFGKTYNDGQGKLQPDRVFLQRNLSFIRNQIDSSRKNAKKNVFASEPGHDNVASSGKLAGKIFIDSIKNNRLLGDKKAELQLFLRFGGSNHISVQQLADFGMPVNTGPIDRSVDVLKDMFVWRQNGYQYSDCYLIIVVKFVNNTETAASPNGKISRYSAMLNRSVNSVAHSTAAERRTKPQRRGEIAGGDDGVSVWIGCRRLADTDDEFINSQQPIDLANLSSVLSANDSKRSMSDRNVLRQRLATDMQLFSKVEAAVRKGKVIGDNPFIKIFIESELPEEEFKQAPSPRKSSCVKVHCRQPMPFPERIFYRFHYDTPPTTDVARRQSGNMESRAQCTETETPSECPLCRTDTSDLISLLGHLRFTHPRFSFVYRTGVGQLSGGNECAIDVWPQYDVDVSDELTSFHHHRQRQRNYGAGSCKSGPVKQHVHAELLVRNRCDAIQRRKQAERIVFYTKPFSPTAELKRGHDRQYYHSSTCRPLIADETDDDNNIGWLTERSKQLLHQYVDLNNGEKALMTMWNLHIIRRPYFGDVTVFDNCRSFLTKYGDKIRERRLSVNAAMHFISLARHMTLLDDQLEELLRKLNY